MTLILSTEDWQHLWDSQVKTTIGEFEESHNWKGEFGYIQHRRLNLRGLTLDLVELESNQNLILRSQTATWGPVSSFFIQGTSRNSHLGLVENITEIPGHHYLEHIQTGIEEDNYFAGEKIIRLRFAISLPIYRQLDATSPFPQEINRLLIENNPTSFYRQGKVTPSMQICIQQILHCPYEKALKQLYLEGKILELATLQYHQFVQEDYPINYSINLKPEDKERLFAAKEMLLAHWTNPPSLMEISRSVGLNDFKLKSGFRKLFGNSVFGYLRDYRLEQARLLLETGELNVNQVARKIGYSHAGYFATSFKNKYRVSPKVYQANRSGVQLT